MGGSSPSRQHKRATKRGFFKATKEDKLSEHLLYLQVRIIDTMKLTSSQREAEAGKNELLSSIFTEIEKLDTWTSKEKPLRYSFLNHCLYILRILFLQKVERFR